MGDQRDGGIAWTDQTWNPVRGCSRVSEGCRNCYAESVARRFSGPGQPYEGLADAKGWTRKVRLVPEHLGDPLRWKRPRRVFVNSMSDLFHESLPFEHIAAIFGVMAAAPQHTFQVLTKRPERAAEFFAWLDAQDPVGRPLLEACAQALCAEARNHPEGASGPLHTKHCADPDGPWPLPNVGIGASVEDQKTADERAPLLLRLPAAWRFISYEPALGPVLWNNGESSWLSCGPATREAHRAAADGDCCESFATAGHHFRGIDWIIVGGESGPGARPIDVAWARQTIAQCREAGVPVFVKQLGARSYDGEASGAVVPNEARVLAVSEKGAKAVRTMPGFVRHLSDRAGANPDEWPEDLRVREFPEVQRGA